MLYIVIFFFLVSIYLYCLLGGADFGAGIIELFERGEKKKNTRELINRAIAPIWEANHMWLIIAVVILFMGFPKIYSQISISLYIPLILLLVGIVLRGTAFTFRHYDAVKDGSQEIYSRVFQISSVIVPMFFGAIVGALVSGKINPDSVNFIEAYIFPWFNIFSISVGIFVSSLFAFFASVFLLGDATKEVLKKEIARKATIANIATVTSGGLVFLSSYIHNIDLAEKFFSNLFSIGFIILATISLPLLRNSLLKGFVWRSRILAGAQLFFILAAFYVIYFPAIIITSDGNNFTLFNSAAPDATITQLGGALLFGSVIIFPALFYLMKIFKIDKEDRTLLQ